MDPFTWFLIVLGILIVGGVLWQVLRKSTRGVDAAVADENRAQATAKAEYNGAMQHHGPNIGPTNGV